MEKKKKKNKKNKKREKRRKKRRKAYTVNVWILMIVMTIYLFDDIELSD